MQIAQLEESDPRLSQLAATQIGELALAMSNLAHHYLVDQVDRADRQALQEYFSSIFINGELLVKLSLPSQLQCPFEKTAILAGASQIP